MAEQRDSRTGISWGWDRGDDGWGEDVNQNFRLLAYRGTSVRVNSATARNRPPATPSEADCYIVGSNATDEWTGFGVNTLAVYGHSTTGSALQWINITPLTGLTIYDEASNSKRTYNGSTWDEDISAGATGPRGPQGPKGDRGNDGARGTAGPQGVPGQAGRDGSQGARGATGPQGERGATGARGPAGPKGDKGDTGARGPQGPQGPQGERGPAGSGGGNGGGTGPAGPQGPIGPAGPKGDKGDPGDPGQRGATGATGATGARGATGPAGPTGPAGARGPAGPKGDKGDTGAQGPAGTGGLTSAQIMELITDQVGNRADDLIEAVAGLATVYPNQTADTINFTNTQPQPLPNAHGLDVDSYNLLSIDGYDKIILDNNYLRGLAASSGTADLTDSNSQEFVLLQNGEPAMVTVLTQRQPIKIRIGRTSTFAPRISVTSPTGAQTGLVIKIAMLSPITLEKLSNTNITSPTQGQVVSYDSSTQQWVNTDQTGSGGTPGPQGERGPAGPKGDTGDTGAVGPAGPAGATGARGPAGATGPRGPAGPKGDKGDKGDPGTGEGSSTLSGLTDTTISSPTDGQVITYDNTSQRWENTNPRTDAEVQELARDAVGAALTLGDNETTSDITFIPNDSANSIAAQIKSGSVTIGDIAKDSTDTTKVAELATWKTALEIPASGGTGTDNSDDIVAQSFSDSARWSEEVTSSQTQRFSQRVVLNASQLAMLASGDYRVDVRLSARLASTNPGTVLKFAVWNDSFSQELETFSPGARMTVSAATYSHTFTGTSLSVALGTTSILQVGFEFSNTANTRINRTAFSSTVYVSETDAGEKELPAGGTTGQALTKTSDLDRIVGWRDPIANVEDFAKKDDTDRIPDTKLPIKLQDFSEALSGDEGFVDEAATPVGRVGQVASTLRTSAPTLAQATALTYGQYYENTGGARLTGQYVTFRIPTDQLPDNTFRLVVESPTRLIHDRYGEIYPQTGFTTLGESAGYTYYYKDMANIPGNEQVWLQRFSKIIIDVDKVDAGAFDWATRGNVDLVPRAKLPETQFATELVDEVRGITIASASTAVRQPLTAFTNALTLGANDHGILLGSVTLSVPSGSRAQFRLGNGLTEFSSNPRQYFLSLLRASAYYDGSSGRMGNGLSLVQLDLEDTSSTEQGQIECYIARNAANQVGTYATYVPAQGSSGSLAGSIAIRWEVALLRTDVPTGQQGPAITPRTNAEIQTQARLAAGAALSAGGALPTSDVRFIPDIANNRIGAQIKPASIEIGDVKKDGTDPTKVADLATWKTALEIPAAGGGANRGLAQTFSDSSTWTGAVTSTQPQSFNQQITLNQAQLAALDGGDTLLDIRVSATLTSTVTTTQLMFKVWNDSLGTELATHTVSGMTTTASTYHYTFKDVSRLVGATEVSVLRVGFEFSNTANATVTRSAFNGTIYVASNVRDVSDLGDVTVASPTDGQVMTYESASSSWKNKAAPTGGGGGTGGTPGVTIRQDSSSLSVAASATRDLATITLNTQQSLYRQLRDYDICEQVTLTLASSADLANAKVQLMRGAAGAEIIFETRRFTVSTTATPYTLVMRSNSVDNSYRLRLVNLATDKTLSITSNSNITYPRLKRAVTDDQGYIYGAELSNPSVYEIVANYMLDPDSTFVTRFDGERIHTSRSNSANRSSSAFIHVTSDVQISSASSIAYNTPRNMLSMIYAGNKHVGIDPDNGDRASVSWDFDIEGIDVVLDCCWDTTGRYLYCVGTLGFRDPSPVLVVYDMGSGSVPTPTRSTSKEFAVSSLVNGQTFLAAIFVETTRIRFWASDINDRSWLVTRDLAGAVDQTQPNIRIQPYPSLSNEAQLPMSPQIIVINNGTKLIAKDGHSLQVFNIVGSSANPSKRETVVSPSIRQYTLSGITYKAVSDQIFCLALFNYWTARGQETGTENRVAVFDKTIDPEAPREWVSDVNYSFSEQNSGLTPFKIVTNPSSPGNLYVLYGFGTEYSSSGAIRRFHVLTSLDNPLTLTTYSDYGSTTSWSTTAPLASGFFKNNLIYCPQRNSPDKLWTIDVTNGMISSSAAVTLTGMTGTDATEDIVHVHGDTITFWVWKGSTIYAFNISDFSRSPNQDVNVSDEEIGGISSASGTLVSDSDYLYVTSVSEERLRFDRFNKTNGESLISRDLIDFPSVAPKGFYIQGNIGISYFGDSGGYKGFRYAT